MKPSELYDLFRKDVVDFVKPYLWSDEEVYAYMDDAYKMFVRLTFGVSDITSDATVVPVVAGEQFAALDPRILKIRRAVLVSTNQPLTISNMLDDTPPEEDYGVKQIVGGIQTPGPVRYVVIGEQDDLCRWVHIPVEDDLVQLSVFRMPLNDITDEKSAFTDVRPQHHLHFMKWMKHLAYSKQDAETFDKAKSDDQKAQFEAYCGQAYRELERQRSKTRAVAYGGL